MNDKFNKLEIKDGRFDNLRISWDCDYGDEDPAKRYPVLLYTPNMDYKNQHHHIELTNHQALVLRNWLTRHLDMVGGDEKSTAAKESEKAQLRKLMHKYPEESKKIVEKIQHNEMLDIFS